MNKRNKKNDAKRKFLYFALTSFIIVFIIILSWFKSGSIISNSEESLSIYNPQKSTDLNISIWYPAEIGTISPFGINRAYPFLILTWLSNIGVPSYINQALLIGLVMICALIFSYILFSHLSNGSFFISFFGSFFYLFNLYSQSQIFRRFLYNFMFAFAYYPLFIYLWIKCLETRKVKYLLLLALSSVIFSFSFNHPATIITFGISAMVIAFVKFWGLRKSKKELLSILFFSLLSLMVLVLVNLWWIYPLTKSGGGYLTSVSNTSESDLKSLQAVSQSYPIQEIALLRQAFWYGSNQHWFEFYQNPLIILLSITIFLICLKGFFRFRTNTFFPTLFGLFIVGLFVSKGTNPPFGYSFYDFLLNQLPVLGAMRNPYEKFGVVLLLPYAFFFAVGLYTITNLLKNNLKHLSIVTSAFLFLMLLVWPTWTGGVFKSEELVKVPNYYKQANTFLNSFGDYRIFHLPITQTYNQRYDWGFYGQDPSEYFFDRPSLSNTLANPLRELFYLNLPQLGNTSDFPRLLGFLGVKNVILHKDAINNPKEILLSVEAINQWKDITKISDMDKLTIYQINADFVKPRFYILDKYSEKNFPDINTLEDKFETADYKKLSPTKYQVTVRNVQKPFILIFNDLYDQKWTALVNSKLPPPVHFKAYGLVNGWQIDQKGDLSIEINLKLWPWED